MFQCRSFFKFLPEEEVTNHNQPETQEVPWLATRKCLNSYVECCGKLSKLKGHETIVSVAYLRSGYGTVKQGYGTGYGTVKEGYGIGYGTVKEGYGTWYGMVGHRYGTLEHGYCTVLHVYGILKHMYGTHMVH